MTDLLPAGAEGACARPAPPKPPPIGKRFQKGHSGNPKGGPKRPEPLTADTEWLFRQTFTVVIDGEEQTLPLARALLLAKAHAALKGDGKAATELLALHGKAEATRAAQAEAKAKKAAEARAQRRREEAEAEDDGLPRLVVYAGKSPHRVFEKMGVWHELPDGRMQITRAAFRALTAMDPGLLERLDPSTLNSLYDNLEPEAAGTDDPPDPPD